MLFDNTDKTIKRVSSSVYEIIQSGKSEIKESDAEYIFTITMTMCIPYLQHIDKKERVEVLGKLKQYSVVFISNALKTLFKEMAEGTSASVGPSELSFIRIGNYFLWLIDEYQYVDGIEIFSSERVLDFCNLVEEALDL